MVCIPCIVVPILLWIYKRFLEPYLYPFIDPLIKCLCSKKPVPAVSKEDGNHNTESRDIKLRSEASVKRLDLSESENKSIANGFAENGPTEVSDKKKD
ncbi:hypothetical protein JRQ81_013142 [Phrynocephalus forsythii]|uniref:CR032 protein n=1 Tax=Phrynocephalus forsythii TaxID=171643 RepID=A0A9Q0Y0J2_9SAUR|nr:hypothetical protein JRQ81_013142 [Phrynocephalus forsythii]